MVIKRVGPMSRAKIAGTLYAILGIVVGGVFSLVAAACAFAADAADTAAFPMMFGAAAIVVFPVLYGCLGFVMALIAWLYNVLAGLVVGIELDLQ